MEITRERISFTFDPRDMLLSLKIGFSFVRAAVAWAIFERIYGFKASSEISAPMYLKLLIVHSSCLFALISLSVPLALFVINLFFPPYIDLELTIDPPPPPGGVLYTMIF